MNPGIPQCKNCWKWGYSTLSCHSHISRCAKCYGAHTMDHHREKAWCCMENKKDNRVATKEGEPCSYVFKCMNCKGDHQVDSYSCPYWHNWFNRDWHGRKQQELFQKQSTVMQQFCQHSQVWFSFLFLFFSVFFPFFMLFAYQCIVVTKQLLWSTFAPSVINC